MCKEVLRFILFMLLVIPAHAFALYIENFFGLSFSFSNIWHILLTVVCTLYIIFIISAVDMVDSQ